MLNRFSSRKTDLGKQYLADRLQGAVSYDRIAGYFCSSVLEIAGEAMEQIPGKIRIICNSGLNPEDVKVAGLAAMQLKQEWCGFKPEDVYTSRPESVRLHRLYDLLSNGKMAILAQKMLFWPLLLNFYSIPVRQGGSGSEAGMTDPPPRILSLFT